ncbi:MAG: tetratricopeptide repeat protein [Deltaproteobacteria bacterium]|nr:tetratricopeptide repeat protein [Deltaproteobacteria bacterium]
MVRHSLVLLVAALLAGTACSVVPTAGERTPPRKTWTCDREADEAFRLGDYDRSIALHQGILEKEPTNALALYHIGYAYGRKGDHEKEAALYEKALDLGFRKEDLFFNLGMAYGETNRIDRAIEAFRRGVEAYPNSADNHFGLALAYQRSGTDDDLAEKMFLRTIELDPSFPEARFYLSLLYADNGHVRKAAAQLRKLLELDPANQAARDMLERIEKGD